MAARGYVPDASDVVWLAFDPQAGHEQAGHRPALVISPASYNGKTGLMVCCPMTSKIKGHPFEVVTQVDGADCAVLSDQVKSLDWKVPDPVPPTEHGYKYRAVYVLGGERVVGFDNERGKGDHCHLDGKELPYNFTTVAQLVEDFIAAVSSRRSS